MPIDFTIGSTEWKCSPIYELDPTKPQLADKQQMWLRPRHWNQGGYDAVFIDKEEKLIRFVQVTVREKHEFKDRFFNSLLDKLVLILGDGYSVEVCFLVPEVMMRDFNIPLNGHLRGCPDDIKKNIGKRVDGGTTDGIDGAGGTDESQQACCVTWRRVVGMDWNV